MVRTRTPRSCLGKCSSQLESPLEMKSPTRSLTVPRRIILAPERAPQRYCPASPPDPVYNLVRSDSFHKKNNLKGIVDVNYMYHDRRAWIQINIL